MLSKRIFTGFVALAMVFTFAATFNASADTTVMQQTTTTTTSHTFNMNLTVGSTGADVVALQSILVGKGFLVMPVGVSMGYFGPLTKSALGAFQASVGISPAVGYFGPITRAYFNTHNMTSTTTTTTTTVPGCAPGAMFSSTTGARCDTNTLPAGCTSTAGYSPITGVRCDSGSTTTTTTTNTGPLGGGETSIDSFDLSDADDDTINEGATEAEVAQIEFDVNDADAQLERADLIFDGNTATEDRPWRVFDHVYLMNGSDVIADMDTSSESDWDETSDNDIFRVRLTGIGEIFREGDTGNLSIAVDVSDSVDDAGTDADWDVYVATNKGAEDGMRFTDSEGIDTFIGEGDTPASFSIVEAGTNSDFTVQEADNSPDADTLEVNETSTSEHTLAIFTMDSDADGGDVKLNDFPVEITIEDPVGAPTSTFADIIDDVFVEIDGTKYSGDYDSGCGTTLADCTDGETATFLFDNIDDDDIVVNAGDSMDAEVSVKFKSQGTGGSNYDNGTTIMASSAVTTSDVEDADSGDDVGDVSGDADGELFTLASEGLGVTLVSMDSDTSGDNDTIGEYTFIVDVTAFGEDQFVELSGTRGTSTNNTGFNYQILDGTNSEVLTGTTTLAVDADEDDEGNNRVRINQNETVRFTFQVFFDAATTGSYKAQLHSINFNNTDADEDSQHVLFPASTYRTTAVNVNAS